jgi:hypothetical protein
VLGRQVALIAAFVGLTLLTNKVAPRYMRWHAHMRRPGSDERDAVFPNASNGNGNGAAQGSNGTSHPGGVDSRELD